jgi:hypothetical protein
MRPAVDALAASFRVLTFSLGSGDLNGYADDVANVMTRAGVDRAAIAVSFRPCRHRFAARHADPMRRAGSGIDPATVASSAAAASGLRAPWILGPIFSPKRRFACRKSDGDPTRANVGVFSARCTAPSAPISPASPLGA